ncbi:hypothetical protein B7463_g5866, partial [Scytalidium lignicola]
MHFLTKELHDVARVVLSTTKMILGPEATHSRVAVVGGLAVLRWTNNYRATKDIDLFLGSNLRPMQLKRELPQAHNAFTINFEAVHGVSYRSPITNKLTTIDFLDVEATVFEPQTRILDELKANELPWSTRDDLISMKFLGASQRNNVEMVLRDIRDIKNLLLVHPSPLLFSGSSVAE